MSAHTVGKPGLSNRQIVADAQPVPWIWDGLLALEAVTLLAAPAKTGKTTLVSLLLDRRRAGGQLLGRAVQPGRTILCSEEYTRLWTLRQPPLDFGDQLDYLRPRGQPSPRTWSRFIDDVLKRGHDLDGSFFDLLIIDTAMTFLPTARHNPATLRNALEELRVVTGLGGSPSSCSTRHRSGPAPRGPLTAFADILINMQAPLAPRGSREVTATRRRHFHGVGRYPGTLHRAAAELNPDGTDYLLAPRPARRPRRTGPLARPRHPPPARGRQPRPADPPRNPGPLARLRATAPPRRHVAHPVPRLPARPAESQWSGDQGGAVSVSCGEPGLAEDSRQWFRM